MRLFLSRQAILISIGVVWSVASFAQTADLILTNGKIVTVDNQFHIIQSLASSNMAVGSNSDLEKLADLLILDRDYLTIPADEIKDIKSLLTMVSGKVVYEVGSK